MTSYWARWRLKSPASRLFTQPFIQTQIKENIKAPRHWPLCGEFTDERWIPAQMASNAENVSIWWRHYTCNSFATSDSWGPNFISFRPQIGVILMVWILAQKSNCQKFETELKIICVEFAEYYSTFNTNDPINGFSSFRGNTSSTSYVTSLWD